MGHSQSKVVYPTFNRQLVKREEDRSVSPPVEKWLGDSAIGAADATDPPQEGTLPEEPEDGKYIGEYRIERKLGKGSYGRVYEVSRLGMRYALKMQFFKTQTDLEMIHREKEMLASLDHPNIVKYYETFSWVQIKHDYEQRCLCIVMELVIGEDMGSILDRLGKDEILAPQIRAKWMAQIFRAVTYIHSQNKAHRDLKPCNIMVEYHTLDIKITDFGLARELEGGLADTVVGTPMYMAPEIRSGAPMLPYDGSKVDVWAIGFILLEMVAGIEVGRKLWKEAETAGWEVEIQKKMKEARVPKVLCEIIGGMVRSQPRDRTRLIDLVNNPMFRGYELCYGLVPDELLSGVVDEIMASSQDIMCLLIAIKDEPIEILSWGLGILSDRLQRIPPPPIEIVGSTSIVKTLEKIEKRYPATSEILQRIKAIRRNSKAGLTPSPIGSVRRHPRPMQSDEKHGWYISYPPNFLIPRDSMDLGVAFRTGSFSRKTGGATRLTFPLPRHISDVLESIWVWKEKAKRKLDSRPSSYEFKLIMLLTLPDGYKKRVIIDPIVSGEGGPSSEAISSDAESHDPEGEFVSDDGVIRRRRTDENQYHFIFESTRALLIDDHSIGMSLERHPPKIEPEPVKIHPKRWQTYYGPKHPFVRDSGSLSSPHQEGEWIDVSDDDHQILTLAELFASPPGQTGLKGVILRGGGKDTFSVMFKGMTIMTIRTGSCTALRYILE
jgi:serine/threonine protein kinase